MLRKIGIYVVMGILVGAIPLVAQMNGNPSGVQGSGEWSVGLSTSILRHGEGNYENYTKRIVVESRYGVSDWLDIFGVAGGFHMKRNSPQQNVNDYNGNYTLGYGGGLNITKSEIFNGKANIQIGGYFVRYPSKGEYAEYFQYGGGWLNRMEYDTREYQVAFTIIIPVQNVNFYFGGVGWGLQRKEEQTLYLMDENKVVDDIPYDYSEGTYQSGMWTGGIVGIEVKLPQQFTCGVEFIGFNEKNYTILFGISQTGGSTW